jgi:pimeloyl-ACP methyl ester carboxylesterase
MVEDCRAQLQLLGIAAPYDVLAVSLGGMVAAQWALMWPDEVERMVLMGTSMRPLSPFYERLRPANYLPLLQLLFGASPEHWEQEILRMTTRHPPYDVLTDWVQLRQRNPVSAANALRQLVAAARFSLPTAMAMEPQSAAKPVLLLAGEGDGLVSAKCTLALARHWNCDAVLHSTAGHDVTLDDGPWVAAQVRRSVLI